MIRRTTLVLAAASAALILATAAGAFSAKVTKVRISDRGNGDAYNVNVVAQGEGVGQIARVAVEFERDARPKPEERTHVLQLISKNNRGVLDTAFPQSTKGKVYTITATLRSEKGKALGSPQTFEVVAGGESVEIDSAADRDPNGRIRRLRLHPVGKDDSGRDLVRQVVVCEGNMIDRVSRVELRYSGAGVPEAPVTIPLDYVLQNYRAIVMFEESAVGETLPVVVTLQDAEGNALGASHSVEIEVEASRVTNAG